MIEINFLLTMIFILCKIINAFYRSDTRQCERYKNNYLSLTTTLSFFWFGQMLATNGVSQRL